MTMLEELMFEAKYLKGFYDACLEFQNSHLPTLTFLNDFQRHDLQYSHLTEHDPYNLWETFDDSFLGFVCIPDESRQMQFVFRHRNHTCWELFPTDARVCFRRMLFFMRAYVRFTFRRAQDSYFPDEIEFDYENGIHLRCSDGKPVY